jgi:hypothetical protein
MASRGRANISLRQARFKQASSLQKLSTLSPTGQLFSGTFLGLCHISGEGNVTLRIRTALDYGVLTVCQLLLTCFTSDQY